MSQLLERIGVALPIIQAPMAGGVTTVELVHAVGEAGALGSFGAAYLTPQQIGESVAALRARTARPFNVNLFAPLEEPAAYRWDDTIARLRAYHADLGIPAPAVPELWSQRTRFDAQLDAVLDLHVPVLSFTFGALSAEDVSRLHRSGTVVVGTATTVDEARMLEERGVDAIVAQGAEAGGHRGTFASAFEDAMIGTMALVPQIVDAVGVPVIASGGIMDGRGIAAALALGAQAVQLGTAFLTVAESGAPRAHKTAVLAANETDTAITRAFSGRAARGLHNRVTREFGDDPASIAPYPLQNDATRAMRRAAADAGDREYLSLWCGQAPRLARETTARALIASLMAQTRAVVGALRM